jgi:hypothetical protein
MIGAMLCASTAGYAGSILAAGSIYGGPSQVRAVCYIYNAGKTPVTLSGPEITNQNGVQQTLVINQCGTTLSAGITCGVAANIANNSTYSCKATLGAHAANVRGILEVRDVDQNVLQNIELR